MPVVYIIILNYKKWSDVCECLETVFRSVYDDFTVIVIDNDSQNDSLKQLMEWAEQATVFKNRLTEFSKDNIRKPISYKYFNSGEFTVSRATSPLPQLVFVQNNENRGFAAGINTVLKHLLHEDAYIWLLNPDMVMEESTLHELVVCAGNNPRNTIIGATIKYHEEPGKVHLYAGGRVNFNTATVEMIRSKNDIPKLDYISGGSLFTHAHNFKELGMLPEDYFLYWEETDWCYRAKMKGYRLCLCENAICYDKISTSIGKSYLAHYYYTRNGLLFLEKYKKEKVATALFFTQFRILKRLLSGQPARAKGVFKGMISFLKRKRHENK